MKDIFSKVFLGNPLGSWCAFLFAIIAGFAAAKLITFSISKVLRQKASFAETRFGDVLVQILKKYTSIAVILVSFYLAFGFITVSGSVSRVLNLVLMAASTLVIVKVAIAFVDFAIRKAVVLKGVEEQKLGQMGGLLGTVHVFIWIGAVIFFLDNIGFKITTVVAGLGVGGVAIALAGQAILKDLFSYFSIFFDRPFEVGDFIIVGDYLGTVEYIGMKTTRIRSLGGEEIIISNSDLTDSRVKNFKRMTERRVVFTFGVIYETEIEKLKRIPGILKQIIETTDGTRFDRCHFSSYGDFALNFEVVYYVLSSDYNKYMDIQQEINIKMAQEFKEEGISFAYPTQLLYLARQN